MIAVTGATGLTGRFLLEAIRQAGYTGTIRILVRPSSDLHGLLQDGVTRVIGDCRDPEAMERLVEGVDTLVHVAGILLAENAVEACLAGGCRRAIFISTAGIYSRYRQLTAAYLRQEDFIRQSGLDYTIIRPTMIYGNERDHNLHKLIRIVNRYPILPLVGGGRALMQPIYAEDLAACIATAAFDPHTVGRDYDVAGREPIAYHDILRTIAKLLGKSRLYINIPFPMALALGYLGELIPECIVNVERIKRLTEDKTLDYKRAAYDLRFSPRTFAAGIAREIQALKTKGRL